MDKRLKQIRKALKMTQTEFGNKLGFARISIAQMESGIMNITDKTIRDVCREFNVDYLWFRTGEGEMFVDKTNDIFAEIDEIMKDEDEYYRNVVKMVVNLDLEDIQLIRKMAQALLAKQKKTE